MKKLWITMLVLVLAGCGGGGGSTSPPSLQQVPVVGDPSGIWQGNIFYADGTSAYISGVMLESGEGRLLTSRNEALEWSETSLINWDSNGVWTFDFTVITYNGPTTGTFSGTVQEHLLIEGDWQLDSGEGGRITLSYQSELHTSPSSLSRVEGLWRSPAGTILTVYSDGSFFMQEDGFFEGTGFVEGCVYNGSIEVAGSSQYNAYKLSMSISPCWRQGSGVNFNPLPYSGLGFLAGPPTYAMGALLDVQMSNGKVNFIPLFVRL